MRVAHIQNNIIINTSKANDDAELLSNQLDVTGIVCSIGDPIVNGSPVHKPSKWHTLNGLNWEVSVQNQYLKDVEEAQELKRNEIETEKGESGLKSITIEQAKNFIDNKIDNAATAEEKVEAIKDILHKIVAFII